MKQWYVLYVLLCSFVHMIFKDEYNLNIYIHYPSKFAQNRQPVSILAKRKLLKASISEYISIQFYPLHTILQNHPLETIVCVVKWTKGILTMIHVKFRWRYQHALVVRPYFCVT